MENSEDALVDNLAIEFLIHLYGDWTWYMLNLSKNPASNIEKSSLDTVVSSSKDPTNPDRTLIIDVIIMSTFIRPSSNVKKVEQEQEE